MEYSDGDPIEDDWVEAEDLLNPPPEAVQRYTGTFSVCPEDYQEGGSSSSTASAQRAHARLDGACLLFTVARWRTGGDRW